MTKEDFDNYNGMLYCMSCKTRVPKIHINYRKVHKNGDILKCNVCQWIERHNGIPKVEGFSNDEIITALRFFIYNKSDYINDLSDILKISIDKSILLFQSLKIGNKKCLVKSNCKVCGKEIVNFPNVYKLHNNLYCSKKCYWIDKKNNAEYGENNKCYNRITTKCSNCGKVIKIIPYNYNLKNSFGDNHNFCTKECYWEYRGKYYTKEKTPMYKYKYTETQKEKMRIQFLKNRSNGNHLNSKIQLKINDLLDRHSIKYEREYIIKYYAIDNYLIDYNLAIEIMGDYWHASPLKYNEDKYMINGMQERTLIHDKQKHTYLKRYKDIEILYLWELDVNKNIDVCEQLILNYIKNKGILLNYHSFNWEYKNNLLSLRNDIIIPYQNMKSDEYRHLIKK